MRSDPKVAGQRACPPVGYLVPIQESDTRMGMLRDAERSGAQRVRADRLRLGAKHRPLGLRGAIANRSISPVLSRKILFFNSNPANFLT